MNQTVKLADAQPGMQVALDVCGENGAVLLAAGAVLSESSLAALARRGVGRIAVVEVLSQEVCALRITEIDQRLELLFRHAGNDPLLGKLREVVRAYRVEDL